MSGPYEIVVKYAGRTGDDQERLVIRQVSRWAAATIEEARDRVVDLGPEGYTNGHEFSRVAEEIAALTSSGGSISLPDGTEIEVELVSWPRLFTLAVEAGAALTDSATEAQIVEGFNAAQGLGGER